MKWCNRLAVVVFTIFFIFGVSMLDGFGQKNPVFQLIQITEDDDIFLPPRDQTDRYYTSGTQIGLYYTKYKRNFLSKLLVSLEGHPDNLYNVSLTQQMYTPANTQQRDIVKGDRPYAGVLYFSHGLISSSDSSAQRVTSQLSFGIMGPYALGQELQTSFHQLINNNESPQGWANQLNNDIILNYFLQYEKRIAKPSQRMDVIGLMNFNVGTLINNLGLGITLRCGSFNSYFSNYDKIGVRPEAGRPTTVRPFQLYFYARPQFLMVMNNSLLQGGPFTYGGEAYRIRKDDINNCIVQFEYGFVIGYKRFGLLIGETTRTSEFVGARVMQTGNLSLYAGI